MNSTFAQGFSYVVQNSAAAEAGAVSDAWINSISDTIDTNVQNMATDMIKTAQEKNLDAARLQGFIAEIWHTHTFNTNAQINNSQNYAVQPDVNTFGSSDVDIKNSAGEVIKQYSSKYINSAKGSYKAQAATPWERYNELRHNAEKQGKSYKSYEKFLEERGLRNDGTDKLSMYLGQGKLIPADQLEEAKKLLTRKIISLKGNTAPTAETPILIERYEEVLKSLDSVIKDGNGNSSIELTHKQALELAKAAKEGRIDEELFKECGLDINKLVSAEDIAKEALSAGLTAATMSLIISLAPTIVNAISMLISEGEIDSNALKAGGINAISAAGKSFLSGTLTSAIVTCCKTGKLGESLVETNPMAVSALVVVAIGTIEIGLKCASGRIDKKEMAREIMQLYVTSAFSYAGGAILTIVCEGFPLAYMIGSLVGGIIGGLIYKVSESLLLSFCINSGCTFFGLVDQNYRLPQSVFDDLGLESFDFTKFEAEQFEYDHFVPNSFSYDSFEYEKFGIKVLRRDLIGVFSIGYSS